MRRTSRVISLVLSLITVACLFISMGVTVFAASDPADDKELTREPVRVTASTIVLDGINTDYEFMICDKNGERIDGLSQWVIPECNGLTFSGLEDGTTYMIKSRDGVTKVESVGLLVTTEKMANLLLPMIILALVFICEILAIGGRLANNNKVKKTSGRLAALAPMMFLGVYVPMESIIILAVEAAAVVIAAAALVNIDKLEKPEEEAVEEAAEEVVEEAAEEVVEEAAEEVVEEATEEVVEEAAEEVVEEAAEEVVEEAAEEVVEEAAEEVVEEVAEEVVEEAAEEVVEEAAEEVVEEAAEEVVEEAAEEVVEEAAEEVVEEAAEEVVEEAAEEVVEEAAEEVVEEAAEEVVEEA
ncbi:MAG: hypothetical protein IKB34_03720, partial [Clostridia bacterium]|nr:hypothetical protein [Clostridia bacterium]